MIGITTIYIQFHQPLFLSCFLSSIFPFFGCHLTNYEHLLNITAHQNCMPWTMLLNLGQNGSRSEWFIVVSCLPLFFKLHTSLLAEVWSCKELHQYDTQRANNYLMSELEYLQLCIFIYHIIKENEDTFLIHLFIYFVHIYSLILLEFWSSHDIMASYIHNMVYSGLLVCTYIVHRIEIKSCSLVSFFVVYAVFEF